MQAIVNYWESYAYTLDTLDVWAHGFSNTRRYFRLVFPNLIISNTFYLDVKKNASHHEVMTSNWEECVVSQLEGDDSKEIENDIVAYGDTMVDAGPS